MTATRDGRTPTAGFFPATSLTGRNCVLLRGLTSLFRECCRVDWIIFWLLWLGPLLGPLPKPLRCPCENRLLCSEPPPPEPLEPPDSPSVTRPWVITRLPPLSSNW